VTSERIRREGQKNTQDADRLIKLAENCRQENAGKRVRPVLAAFGLLDPETANA